MYVRYVIIYVRTLYSIVYLRTVRVSAEKSVNFAKVKCQGVWRNSVKFKEISLSIEKFYRIWRNSVELVKILLNSEKFHWEWRNSVDLEKFLCVGRNSVEFQRNCIEQGNIMWKMWCFAISYTMCIRQIYTVPCKWNNIFSLGKMVLKEGAIILFNLHTVS